MIQHLILSEVIPLVTVFFSTNTLEEPKNGTLLDCLDSAGYENFTEYADE